MAGTPPVDAIFKWIFGNLSSNVEGLSVLPSCFFIRNDRSGSSLAVSESHPILSTLWYEDEDGKLLSDNPDFLSWEQDVAILTDQQKRCIAHFLMEILKQAQEEEEENGEVSTEADRIEHMLRKYWSAWL